MLEIVKAAGHPGMLIVIDEAETILRMRTADSRHKSLNGIRQICDGAGDYPGLLWLFTGTPSFFDTRKGIAGLAPLHGRIHFLNPSGYTSLRQAQLELKPFDAVRLKNVAVRLRELYPASDRQRLMTLVSDGFLDQLVADVTAGFKGDVGVVPRQFLRQLVNVMDLVDEDIDGFDPAKALGFRPEALSAEEEAAMAGRQAEPVDPADDVPIPAEDNW